MSNREPSNTEEAPMNRTPITIVVVVILCAVGFAYSQGWLNMSRPAPEIDTTKVSTSQMLNEDNSKMNIDQFTRKPNSLAR
jgi:hypothetical protein